jgi:hypothetical protein
LYQSVISFDKSIPGLVKFLELTGLSGIRGIKLTFVIKHCNIFPDTLSNPSVTFMKLRLAFNPGIKLT